MARPIRGHLSSQIPLGSPQSSTTTTLSATLSLNHLPVPQFLMPVNSVTLGKVKEKEERKKGTTS